MASDNGATCMDDSAFSSANGNKIQMWDCTGGANYCNGTLIEMWTCNGGSNQQWHLP